MIFPSATLNYREIEPQKSDIVKVDLLINGKVLDALSFVCHRSRATPDGRALCQKLKRVIDRQQYEISIQAALGGKIFAKERIAPYRKDVLIKSGKTVGGGDSTRKKKLLAKQKQGKRRMRTVSNVQLSQDAFCNYLACNCQNSPLFYSRQLDVTTPSSSTKKCRGKWRKPTYLIRKEEKCELLEQLKELESQVSFLQNRTSIAAWQEKDRQQIETELKNNVLRNSVKQQQLGVLTAQSALSELTHAVHNRCPLDLYIHLGRDWTKRTEILTSLRAQQCQDALELVEKRTQFMTEVREYTENAQFMDEAGDFCSIRFDITPIDGLKTVKEAFEFIQFHIKHMDTKPCNSKYTCTSEIGPDKNIMHRRLIISEVENVATETNFVMFSQHQAATGHHMFGDPDKQGDQGVMVMNFIDKDDLYPYRPQDCVRLDISGVMTLKSYHKNVKTPKGEVKEEPAVVLTRWMLQKLRRTDLPVPTHVLQTMRDRINDPGNTILRAVKDAREPVQLEAKDTKVLSM
ncbi:GTP-binding protein LepA [Phytophthora palmivora]|uniref:GTP-binding protein LepA n=1 Tax=Phytophthora palmivora TaxID=4796 RepID=A0A2P4XS03_9STRA|nr:GTP-binding protein LepA [Phytophthora palmivora]